MRILLVATGALASALLMGCQTTQIASAEGLSGMDLVNAQLRADPNAEVIMGEGDNRVVCRREVVVGSRVPQVVCRDMVWEEWNGQNTREVLQGVDRQVPIPIGAVGPSGPEG